MAVVMAPRPPLRRVVAGAVAATLARSALRVLRFHRVTALVRWLAPRTRRPACTADVLIILAAIDRAAAWLPFRVACLERSLAAVLLLAVHRKGVTWQIGVRTPPFALHAWLTDTMGRPVGERESTVAYQPLVRVSPFLESERSFT